MSAPRVFDQNHYELLNRARGQVVSKLLNNLRPTLKLQTGVDVGCGTGHFSGLLHSMGFEMTGVDGRRENAEDAAGRHPGIRFHTINAEENELLSLGTFDLVFCFGLLYHLENPLRAIRHLHAMTNNLFLMEGVIFPGDEPGMVLIDEFEIDDQGLKHIAFYPTEACLVKMLYRAGFKHVYGLKEQPDHPDYRGTSKLRRVRTMLAASFVPLKSEQLERVSEPRSEVIPWDPMQGGGPSRRGELTRSSGRARSIPLLGSTPEKAKNLARGVRLMFRRPPVIDLPFGARWRLEGSALDEVLQSGSYERFEIRFVERFLKPGMVVLDIGAHHGLYTLLASRSVGKDGKVVAFEPSPRERRCLKRHLRLNRCRNVRVEGVALDQSPGESDLFLVEGSQDYCNSLRPPAVLGGTRTVRVQVTTLDEYLSRDPVLKIDFIKLDVEGAELGVLKGAKRVLTTAPRPVLLVEVYDIRTEPWGYRAREIVQLLVSFGYRWFDIGPDGPTQEIDADLDAYDKNLVAVPKELVESFTSRTKSWRTQIGI